MRISLAMIIPTGTVAAVVTSVLSFAQLTPASAADMTADEAYSIIRGGIMYDKWYAVAGSEKPRGTHKAWPASNTKKKGSTTHRCKSCHGWDYSGKDGAYASGSYKTGITGIRSYAGADLAKVIGVLSDDTHGLGGNLSKAEMTDLAMFVSKGQVDMRKYIDYATKAPKGDAAGGGAIYAMVCSKCHGTDGRKPKDMPALGGLTNKNPWEVMHKILTGHPGEDMPSIRVFGAQPAADTMAYMMSLPKDN